MSKTPREQDFFLRLQNLEDQVMRLARSKNLEIVQALPSSALEGAEVVLEEEGRLYLYKYQESHSRWRELSVSELEERVTALEAVSSWTTVTYGTNWRRLSNEAVYEVQARKTLTGEVLLRGIIERTTSTFSFPSLIFTLPVGYEPARSLFFWQGARDGTATFGKNIYRIFIATNGEAKIDVDLMNTANGTVETFVYLDGLTFATN